MKKALYLKTVNEGTEFSLNQPFFVLKLIVCVCLLEITDNSFDIEPFIRAARYDDSNVVAGMLRDGVPVDCCDGDGQTALLWAALYNSVHVANLLLKNGANVNSQTRGGTTPLIAAARRNHAEVIEVLLHHGADLSIEAEGGRTALDAARIYNRQETIRLLERY